MTREQMIDLAVRRCTKPATRKAIANRANDKSAEHAIAFMGGWFHGRVAAIRAEFQKLAR